ncbi:hypothetical protein LshimejAT787_0303120 [Lyophyllum shimeji]|uniref:Uncharacterized protein n=1 Tax=Lyophyllum shimeji TaxID=47721 RepID=A0A9P3UIU0_LYOSH|nr:hypothetical protein LshimejAT787_0303120 [Lyophyllum shimeji]
MLRSMNSPSDAHDDHLRQLLDQRAARADSQGRFSALSNFDDTPSIYSPPFFSPRQPDHGPSSPDSQLRSPTTSTFSVRTHQERLNDPSASMLDLDDDPRLSTASDIYNDEDPPADDDSEERRMSYLGPKMRFHSRAPWEMEEDAIEEDDEPEHGSLFPSSKKGFGFSSPRSSNASRPSMESTRSQTKSKQSFETTTSQISYPRGALYALAQESLSTSSLGASSAGQKTLRGKFSLSRVRSESPNNSAPASPAPGTRPPNHIPLNSLPPQSHPSGTQSPTSSSRHRQTDDFHPYANPDLVFSLADEQPHLAPDQTVSRSGSVTTVTDSVAHSSVSRAGTKSTLAPVTSVSSVNPKNRASTVSGKEISSPMPVLGTAHRLEPNGHEDPALMLPPPGLDNLPGWTDRGPAHSFSLISLEEAREQRMRSATTQSAISQPVTATSTASSSILFPDDSDNRGQSIDHNGSGLLPQRARARSISAGSKAKNALHTIVGAGQARPERHYPDSAAAPSVPGKTLKHKKSGFMRLFNGARGQEKEEKVQPPPVPPLSDAYAALNAQAAQKAPKLMSQRIPVPERSYSVPVPSPSQGSISPTSLYPTPVRPSPSPKRPVPLLSINTQPQDYAPRAPVSAVEDSSRETRTLPSSYLPPQPWLNNSSPQSAPANVTEFPALKLRPVSTLFSAQFKDHIMTDESRPSLETDVGTPGSSTTNVFFPVTPGSGSRSDLPSSDNKPTCMTTISEDQSQDPIVTSKLAWQRQIWELEGQVRDLKAEIAELRKADSDKGYCETCGRGQRPADHDRQGGPQDTKDVSVVNRPRARTGISSRFGSTVS